MKKSILYISLAVVALVLAAIKSSQLMTPWLLSLSDNFKTNQVIRQSQSQERKLVSSDIEGEVVSSEIDLAIRRQLDADADKDVTRKVSDSKIKHQQKIVELYSQMLPDEAAHIIETMENDKVAELLQLLDSETAASILSHLSAEKAASVTIKMLNDMQIK